jgi:hypothetical protein
LANTVNATWNASGPAFTFQQVAFGGKDMAEMAYRGSATFTGDAATGVVTINFIDGTQTPFFTPGNPPTAVAPALVIATVGKGATVANASGGVTAITTTGFTFQAQTATTWPATSFTIDFIVVPF